MSRAPGLLSVAFGLCYSARTAADKRRIVGNSSHRDAFRDLFTRFIRWSPSLRWQGCEVRVSQLRGDAYPATANACASWTCAEGNPQRKMRVSPGVGELIEGSGSLAKIAYGWALLRTGYKFLDAKKLCSKSRQPPLPMLRAVIASHLVRLSRFRLGSVRTMLTMLK